MSTQPAAEVANGRSEALPRASVAAENQTPAIKIWAGFGVAVLAFCAYLLISWVTGPNFERVPQGPSEPPTWMQVVLWGWQTLSIPAALFMLWRFVVRPYRRDKTVGVDGVLLLAFCSIWVQDPWSSAGNHWFVYNTYLFNMGSWANELPWFNAFGRPGAMTSEPIFFTPAAYVYIMLIGSAVGCWFMRKAKQRRPGLTNLQLIAVCLAGMLVFDIVLEGLIWIPLGVFAYPGGHWALFPSHYYKFPLTEMFTIGSVFTAFAAFRYFRDDRGYTIAERGIEKLRLSPGKTLAVRALAVTAFVHLAMFLGYNVPNTLVGLNSTEWPADLQERSYFTNGICGDGTDRVCPGGSMPAVKTDSAYPNTAGQVTNPVGEPGVPADYVAPDQGQIIPFDVGPPGGSE